MQEELEVISTIFKQQFKFMLALEHVLDSSSYRITNRVRINAFKRLEQPALEMAMKERYEYWKDMEKIQDQITKTTQVLRYNLEIAEEGQSKAILVFTLVTIIFLPLSFVASLFGMNTTDIRGTDRNQSIFWVVALPLTAVIGGLSLLVAYGRVGERLNALEESFRQRNLGHGKISFTKTVKSRDEEDFDATESKLRPSTTFMKQRRTGTFTSNRAWMSLKKVQSSNV